MDVDLDCPEAMELADDYLPPTLAVTGRPSAQRSHRWYYSEVPATKQYRDPEAGDMIVELRSNGGQTLVGPSRHDETGEPYDALDGEPARVPAAHLHKCVKALHEEVVRRRHGTLPGQRSEPGSAHKRITQSSADANDVEHRALAYLDKMPPAISGQGGHKATYAAATALVHGFGLSPDHALNLLLAYFNPRCRPPWTEKELRHKVEDAANKPHDRPHGWLRDQGESHGLQSEVDLSVLLAKLAPGGNGGRKEAPEPALPHTHSQGMTQHIRSVRDLLRTYPTLRPPVIHGLLREGETMNVISAPKLGKSWLVTDLALAVAAGNPWFGFETERGEVLIVDNELHGETIANRIPKVAMARDIRLDDVADRVFVESLRGRLQDIFRMGDYFASLEPGRFKIIVLDAFYRFMPMDKDENDNGTMANIYNAIDTYADRLGCCFVLIHHSTKGNQSWKSITDVGAGAGAQSRATDTHLVLRPHDENDAAVLDAAVRSWPPVLPRCLRWTFPVWEPADDLDPSRLRSDRPRKTRSKQDATPAPEPEPWTVERFVAQFVASRPRAKQAVMESASMEGLSRRKANGLLNLAVEAGLVHRWTFAANQPHAFATEPQPEETAS